MSHKPRCLPPAAAFDTILAPTNGRNVAVAVPVALGVRVAASHALVLTFTVRGGGIGVRLFFEDSPGDANNAESIPVLWLTRSPMRIYLPSKIVDADVRPMTPATAEDVSFYVEQIESNHP